MIDILKNEYQNITAQIDIEKLKNKSILVTGANGLIGSYMIDYLKYIDMGINIYALSRSKDKLEKRFEKNCDINFIEQDLSEPFKTDIKFDYIIHAASNAHPMAFSQDPVGTMKTNLLGTINLLELSKACDAKFLYLSTGEIYGNNTDHIFTENDLGIVDTKLARSCYPESKRAAETLCMAYHSQYNVCINIARLCYIYGATITDTNSRADAQFLRNAIEKQDIVMKSDGLQRRTYCYVADCVCGLLYILLYGKSAEVYNISNPYSILSVREYAQTLAAISGVNLVFELPDEVEKKGYSKNADSILDSSKLINLGWKPIYDINHGLNNTINIKREMNV